MTICTLPQITLSISFSTNYVKISHFDDPRSQLGCLHFAPNDWQVTTLFPLFHPHFGPLGFSTPFLSHLRIYLKLRLKSSNTSICTGLVHDWFDALLFMELLNQHILLSHWVSNFLGVLFSLYLPCESHHFRPCWLTSGFCNMDWLHNEAFLHSNLAKIAHSSIEICAILFLLGANNIDHSLQLRALDALEEVVDFSDIVHTAIAIICNTLHDGMVLFMESNILVSISWYSLMIILGVLQLSFCICCHPCHMIMAKKMLMDVKEYSSTFLHDFAFSHRKRHQHQWTS